MMIIIIATMTTTMTTTMTRSHFQDEITLRAEGIAAEAAATTGLALKTGYNEDAAMKGVLPSRRRRG